MAVLLLIRHADNDVRRVRLSGRLPGVHLNAKGREQAEALAQTLAGHPIKAVFASPMERAFETASPLAQALNIEVQPLPGVNETDYGELEGLTFKQLRRMKAWKSSQASPSQARFPGGESYQEAQQRIVAALENVTRDDAMVAVVSHADPIRLALAHFLNIPLDDYNRLEILPASISVVEFKNGKTRVHHINLVQKLEFPPDKPVRPRRSNKAKQD